MAHFSCEGSLKVWWLILAVVALRRCGGSLKVLWLNMVESCILTKCLLYGLNSSELVYRETITTLIPLNGDYSREPILPAKSQFSRLVVVIPLTKMFVLKNTEEIYLFCTVYSICSTVLTPCAWQCGANNVHKK